MMAHGFNALHGNQRIRRGHYLPHEWRGQREGVSRRHVRIIENIVMEFLRERPYACDGHGIIFDACPGTPIMPFWRFGTNAPTVSVVLTILNASVAKGGGQHGSLSHGRSTRQTAKGGCPGSKALRIGIGHGAGVAANIPSPRTRHGADGGSRPRSALAACDRSPRPMPAPERCPTRRLRRIALQGLVRKTLNTRGVR